MSLAGPKSDRRTDRSDGSAQRNRPAFRCGVATTGRHGNVVLFVEPRRSCVRTDAALRVSLSRSATNHSQPAFPRRPAGKPENHCTLFCGSKRVRDCFLAPTSTQTDHLPAALLFREASGSNAPGDISGGCAQKIANTALGLGLFGNATHGSTV